MGRFKSPGHAQRFLSAFEPIRGHFHPFQHQQSAPEFRDTMSQRFENWRNIDGAERCSINLYLEPIAEKQCLVFVIGR